MLATIAPSAPAGAAATPTATPAPATTRTAATASTPAPTSTTAPDPASRPGGAATLAPGRAPGLGRLAPGLTLRQQFDLGVGRSFFRDPWVAAPATTTVRDGLGPLFEAQSCAACHPDGGAARVRARSPEDAGARVGGAAEQAASPGGELPGGIVLRIALPGRDPARRAVPDPTYGDQLQRRGIAPRSGAADASAASAGRPFGEGTPVVAWETLPGRYADGEPYELRRPSLRVLEPAYGPLAPSAVVAARRAPAVIGAGLLDALPEAAILARADPDDRDGDGISGRPNRVWDHARGGRAVGRFGWKAGQPTLRQQVAAAFRDDIGITSGLYPGQPCTEAQAACAAAPSGGDRVTGVEIDDQILGAVTDFVAGMGVAARPAGGRDEVARGERLFAAAGCVACHAPTLTTGAGRWAALTDQQIAPYTDLLLHDMGPGLSAGQVEFEAEATEWRTPPLWGVGRAARDAGAIGFLHDGRARTLAEAILWHGGEAQAARDRFAALPRDDRAALLAFLGSL